MTVTSTLASVQYTGSGTTGPFPVTFAFIAPADLRVQEVDTLGNVTLLTYPSGYTVTGGALPNSSLPQVGSITLTNALATGWGLTIDRGNQPNTNPLSIPNYGPFQAKAIEGALDRLTIQVQQNASSDSKAIHVPLTDPSGIVLTLPSAIGRANQYLAFDGSGNVFTAGGTATTPPISTFWTPIVAYGSAAPSLTALGVTSFQQGVLGQASAGASLTALGVTSFQQGVLGQASAGASRTALGGVTTSVATIAALKALATTDLTGEVMVQGYYAAGDGGGGPFWWNASDATADNGGTVIAPTSGSGRWNRILTDDLLNVRDFGATGNGISDDTTAIQAALNTGRGIYFPDGTYAISATLTISSISQRVHGEWMENAGGTNAGTTLLWIGTATPGYMFQVNAGAHNPCIDGFTFDANNKINTCLFLQCGTGQSLQMPRISNILFRGYLTKGCVLGSDSLTVLGAGQLQICTMEHITWWGGGASAVPTAVVGLLYNAQNCEVLNCESLYFDPYIAANGGPYLSHQNHIVSVSGGLNIRGMLGTRALSYAILDNGGTGLVLDHFRSEDLLLVSIAAAQPSNPIYIRNILHRCPTSAGTEVCISIGGGAGVPIEIENCNLLANLNIASGNLNNIRIRNVQFASLGAPGINLTSGFPYLGTYDLEATPGIRKLYGAASVETWYDDSANMLYQNSGGSLSKVKSIGSTQIVGKNLGGQVTVTGTATTGAVVFGTAEPDANYLVLITPYYSGGTPAAGSNRPLSVSVTATGFTLTVETAPGAGNSVTFNYFIYRS